MSSALTALFYVVIAQKYLGAEAYILGLFIVSKGVAHIISASFWGRMADSFSKRVM